MKLHELRPADGAHTARTRVGRGIAAGKGKTAGRGTKGQKARAGGSIPPWFEGGQTPLHMRIPKLRGFRNRGKVDYEIVNVGDIAARVDSGAFGSAGTPPRKGEPMTINADVLRAVGLVRDVRKPLKVLGGGELSTALFVVADAFTKSATAKIQAAGGSVNVLEVPTESRPAIGVGEAVAETSRAAEAPSSETPAAEAAAAAEPVTERAPRAKPGAAEPVAGDVDESATAEPAAAEASTAKPPRQAKAPRAPKAPAAAADDQAGPPAEGEASSEPDPAIPADDA